MPGFFSSDREVLQHIRSFSNIPVMMVTARMQVQDRVKGLSNGADDYLIKPFSLDELLARVTALLRRAYAENAPDPETVSGTLECAEVRCDVAEHRAFAGETELILQNLEFRLLAALPRSPGHILTYDYLMSSLWEEGEGSLATLRVTIGKLRTKLKDTAGADLIEDVHGAGYRFLKKSAETS